MNVKDIEHLAVERIFLIPDASEGALGYVWCDDPAPSDGMDASEAVEYVRKDVYDARIAQLEADCAAHKAAEETQIALREKAEEREQVLAAQFVALQDASIDLIHASSEEEAGDAMDRIGDCSEKQARDILSRRDALKQAEGADLFADSWGWGEFRPDESDVRKWADDKRRKAEAKQ